MPKFQAAEKLHEEVVRLFVELDSSLIKVKDENGRSPSDLVSSQELFLLNLCQQQETKLYWPNLFLTRCGPFLRYGAAFPCWFFIFFSKVSCASKKLNFLMRDSELWEWQNKGCGPSWNRIRAWKPITKNQSRVHDLRILLINLYTSQLTSSLDKDWVRINIYFWAKALNKHSSFTFTYFIFMTEDNFITFALVSGILMTQLERLVPWNYTQTAYF